MSLDVVLDGIAAREMFRHLLTLETPLVRLLVEYLGYFRSSGILGWERASRILRAAMHLTNDQQLLAEALDRVVTALRPKRERPGWSPLRDHSYLKKTLASIKKLDQSQDPAVPPRPASSAPDAPAIDDEERARVAASIAEFNRGLFGGGYE